MSSVWQKEGKRKIKVASRLRSNPGLQNEFHLSSMSASLVTTRMSKLWKVSSVPVLVCTKLSSKPSFSVLYNPGGARSNPKQWATMAENLQGEEAVQFNSCWNLAETLGQSMERVIRHNFCLSRFNMIKQNKGQNVNDPFSAERCVGSLLQYPLAPTVGCCLPLHSRSCLATDAQEQAYLSPCRVVRFSLSYTAHLCEWRKQSNKKKKQHRFVLSCPETETRTPLTSSAKTNTTKRWEQRILCVCEQHGELMSVPCTY